MEKLKIVFLLAAVMLFIGVGTSTKVEEMEVPADKNYSAEQVSLTSHDKKIAESVLLLEIYLDMPDRIAMLGSATGFSVKYDRKENASYIMTNNHVCDIDEDMMFISYIRPDDPVPDLRIHEDRKMEIIGVDPDNDLCLLKASGDKIPAVKIKSSKSLQPMDNLYSIGAPAGVYPIWIDCKFSGYIDRTIGVMGMPKEGNDFMLLSGTVIGGQSGSPVYDSRGKVVGVIFATLGRYGGMATPSDTVIDFLKEYDI